MSVELDNRREITGLKDILSQLNTTVAVNTEATKALKESLEKEFNRHSEDRKGLESRVSTVESQVDQMRLAMADSKRTNDTLERLNTSITTIEASSEKIAARCSKIEAWIDNKTGVSTGVLWVCGVLGPPALGMFAYGLDMLIHKITG